MNNRPNRKETPGHQAPRPSGSGAPKWVWFAVLGVVVVAVGTALLLSNSDGASDLTVGDVSVSGSVLPPYAAGQPDPTIGTTAPSVTGVTFADEPIGITDDGTPKVVAFMAHWCPVCQREVPVIVDWYDNNPDLGGVEVITVATAIDRTRGNYPPGAWLRNADWPFETMVDNVDNRAAEVFGLTAFPYFVAIDAEGQVVARVSGEIGPQAFAGLVEAARTGVPVNEVGGGTTPFDIGDQ